MNRGSLSDPSPSMTATGIKKKAISKNKGSKGPERATNPEKDLPEQSVQKRYEQICNLLVEKGKMIAKFKNEFIYLSPSEVELKKEYLAAAKNKKK